MRSALRAGVRPGQPKTVPTDPKRIKHRPKTGQRYCGECFRPRNSLSPRLFCNQCLTLLFGAGEGVAKYGYDSFLRSERQRTINRERRLRE